MRMRLTILAILALAACGRSSKTSAKVVADAAPAAPDAGVAVTLEQLGPLVEAAARPLVDGGYAPALVVALIDDSGNHFLSYGRVRDDGPPASEDTLFEIGSVTQVFTSLVLAQLVEAKKVELDEPVAKLLPPGTKVPASGDRQITLRDLATHRSSLSRLPDLAPNDPADPYARYDAARLYTFLARYTLPSPPGTVYDFSNLGAALLGHALSLRAGVPYEQLVAEGIAAPLGMTSTFINIPAAEKARLAQGHEEHGEAIPPWSFDVLAPAGALHSSARDLAIFVRAEMDLLPGAGAARLRTAMDATQVPRHERPGGRLGLAWLTDSKGHVFGHNGQTGGYFCFVVFDRMRHQGVIVLASGSSEQVEKLGGYIWQTWRGQHAEPPKLPPVVVLDTATLDGYAGEYTISKTIGIKVWREGNHLRAQPTGQGPDSIWATAPDHFQLRKVDAQIEFERGADGKVVALTLIEEAARQRAPRKVAGAN